MKKFVLVLGLIFLLGVVSASGYWLEDHDGFGDSSYKEKYDFHYRPDYDLIVSKTVWTYYDNEDRFSTYDYRHGYTYRATSDYYDRKVALGDVRSERLDVRYGDGYYSRGTGIRYEYVPYLRVVEGRECYTRPPADKLFYVKC